MAEASADNSGNSRCLLLELSHDELGVIFDGLADPLQPVVAVAFSSTCKGLRTPLLAALEVLKERHARAVALCRKAKTSCAELRVAEELDWSNKRKTADDMATLAMILQTNGLPWLRMLDLSFNGIVDAGMQVLCEGFGHGAAPSLQNLALDCNIIGPAGAEALAAALSRGALLKLWLVSFNINPIGSQGVKALAAPLRTLPALKELYLYNCGIGDEGVASLFANLGKDDFKALEYLWLGHNQITDAGMTTLVAALDSGRLPRLLNDHSLGKKYFAGHNRASASAIQAVEDALAKRSQ